MAIANGNKDNAGRAIISTLVAFLFLATVRVLIKLETLSSSIEWIVFVQYASFYSCL